MLLGPEPSNKKSPNEKTVDATTLALGNLDSHDSYGQQLQIASTSPSKYPRLFSRQTWLYEIASLGLAFAVLAGLIGLLGYYDGKPDPLWRGGITLNTVVSIASTLYRLALMYSVGSCISQLLWVWFSARERPLGHTVLFDQASRGASGSLKLLFSRALGSTASLGAIITLLNIAAGPFFQQTLAFYNHKTPQSSSQSWTSSAFSYSGNAGNRGTEPGDELPFNMKSAVLTGLLSSGLLSSPQPPFMCPSGNCTWDPFSTLAVGARCYDTSAEFTITCGPWDKPDSDISSEVLNCTIPRANNSLVQSPGKVQLIKGFPFSESLSSTPVFTLETKELTSDDLNPGFWDGPSPSGDMLQIEWLSARNLYYFKPGMPYISSNSTFEAATCFLYTAVRELSARVESGIYSETISKEILAAESTNDTRELSFTFRNTASGDISIDFFEQSVLFQGVQMAMQGADWGRSGSGLTTVTMMGSGLLSNLRGTQLPGTIPTMLYQSPNITDSIYNLAHYMTASMRTNDTLLDEQNNRSLTTTAGESTYIAPSHRVSGTVYVNRIHVWVRWAWLTLPAALLILTSILLAITIWDSYRKRVGVWKGSPLALLLNSDWQSQHVYTGAMTVEGIEQDVKDLRATFVSGQAGSEQVDGELKKRLLISA